MKQSEFIFLKRMKIKAVLRALLRQNRECSISMYLMLQELEEGELSSLALERRLGIKAVRMLIHEAQDRRDRWITYREEEGSGKIWRLTKEGRAVLNRMQQQMGEI